MNRIRSIIIDDEPANRELLEQLLKKHCSSIDVCGSGASTAEGYELILAHRPDLVFLDIRMPGEDGFDLLRMFEKPEFNVIFVTSYDEYAVKAFEFNAVDYILKPLDYTRLIRSVEKAVEQIRLKVPVPPFVQFIRSMDEVAQHAGSIPFHVKGKVTFIDIDRICYIQGMRNYCEVVTEDKHRLLTSKTLSEYEQLLLPHGQFLRISKGFLININFIRSYTKGKPCFIEMKNDDCELEVSRRKKQQILQFFKARGEDPGLS